MLVLKAYFLYDEDLLRGSRHFHFHRIYYDRCKNQSEAIDRLDHNEYAVLFHDDSHEHHHVW